MVVRWKPPVACLQRTGGLAGAWRGSPVFQGGGGGRGYTVKKKLAVFPSPAGTSLTKLFLAGKNLSIPVQGEFGK